MAVPRSLGRRRFLCGVGGAALVGSLAGCSGDGNGGGDGGAAPDAVASYLDGTGNFGGVTDLTGRSKPTVQVGVSANGGHFGFGPAAVRIDAGTTVTWEWTGQGSSHNVVEEDGAFESELTAAAGHTFEYAFDAAGTVLYYCQPHRGVGMKGAVVVE